MVLRIDSAENKNQKVHRNIKNIKLTKYHRKVFPKAKKSQRSNTIAVHGRRPGSIARSDGNQSPAAHSHE
jgi:hypothetical protein